MNGASFGLRNDRLGGRPTKRIVRTRTGCQNCRDRRRKCDEARPECRRCVSRGVPCSGYQRPLAFRDLSQSTAETSRRVEAARWAALRQEEERLARRRRPGSGLRARAPVETTETSSSDDLASSDDASGGSRSREHSVVSPGEDAAASLAAEPADPSALYAQLVGPAPQAEAAATDDGPDEEALVRRLHDPMLLSHLREKVLAHLPVAFSCADQYMENPCFRHALLAVGMAHGADLPESGEPRLAGPVQSRRTSAGREHYLAAVKELQARLGAADERAREQQAAAVLLLAYYEIERGSAFASIYHARGVEALLARLDLTSAATPEIFKAWRLLRYDTRLVMMPYRASALATDAHDAYSALDPQLAIRDIFTQLWQLHGRHTLEAPFRAEARSGTGAPSSQDSPSKQAAFWIKSMLNRACERRNCERGDFYREALTEDEILRRCERLGHGLDQWYASLPADAHPRPKLDSARPFGPCSSSSSGASSGLALVPLQFASDRRAVDYMAYLGSRLIASYLTSLFAPSAAAASATTTEAWARLLLGAICGLERQEFPFTYLQTEGFLYAAALLSEGTAVVDAVLEQVIPRVLRVGIRESYVADWIYLQKTLVVVRRERLRGRAIRFLCLDLDEDYEHGQYRSVCAWVAFGDYNGKGYFKECMALDP